MGFVWWVRIANTNLHQRKSIGKLWCKLVQQRIVCIVLGPFWLGRARRLDPCLCLVERAVRRIMRCRMALLQ